MNSIAVGIDVSKATFVVSIDKAKPFELANTQAKCLELAQRLPKGAIIHLEATGGYERWVRHTLEAKGFVVHLHNPLNARRMSQARSVKAKTDPIDAIQLAESGPMLPQRKPKSLEHEHLADHSRTIDTFVKMVASLKKNLNRPCLDEIAAQGLALAIEDLEHRIQELEASFATRIRSSSFGAHYTLSQSIPGVGPVTARRVLAELPANYLEATGSQLASYAGMVPLDYESGKFKGKAHIGRGNSRLKGSTYMAALSLLASDPSFKAHYHRLRERGSCHQQAIVPLMRKLLIRIVAVLQRGTPWTKEAPPA